ncbi:hypothetical protein ACU6U9_20340 [Pseudomonas sp. HK3]
MFSYKSLSVGLLIVLYGCSSQEYMCFVNPEFTDEKLCYDYKTHQEKDRVAINAASKLFKHIEDPGDLARLGEGLREKYTDEGFSHNLIKYFSGLTQDDISFAISSPTHTAVYLKSRAIIYYSHVDSAFIFYWDDPIYFSGASQYFSYGFQPIKIGVKENNSICNIGNEGVIFMSAEKESFFYNDNKTFCTYNGMAFTNANDELAVWPIDQLGKSLRENP